MAVSLLVGGAVVALELLCASKNHPEQVAQIHAATEEFLRRFKPAIQKAQQEAGQMVKSVRPALGEGVVKVRTATQGAMKYAYRKSVDAKGIWEEMRK
ncbi:hypothetical protein [Acidovorax sp. WCS2018Cala2-16]|uniref:hypothetical protein n=1 Tax=Acidovorax sp. WCS2018Cala2-16 TaxID=3073621 RepID=UPI0028834B5E|nr:hypothetical protein [Acidovorax sp. WCS2018Cala2-16]